MPAWDSVSNKGFTLLWHKWDCDHVKRLWQIPSCVADISLGWKNALQLIYDQQLTKVRHSNDLLVTFTSLCQTAHASSPLPLMAQFQQQKYNQSQHWPAVCLKNIVFMRQREASKFHGYGEKKVS